MRLSAVAFAAIALAATGAAAYGVAWTAAGHYQRATQTEVAQALAAAGLAWATVDTDGLEVAIGGQAPSEASRFHALDIVRTLVDDRRIADVTTVRTVRPAAAPPFALELMRNEAEVSLIGLVPETGGRAEIRDALAKAGLDPGATAMVESAAAPAPPGWSDSLAFGLGLLSDLPRAKIRIEPARVDVVAVAESGDKRAALERRLRATAPKTVTLSLDITAPRPVITPFAVDMSLSDGTLRFDACSAETADDVALITAAARKYRLAAAPDCHIGLGAPSPGWATAVTQGIEALGALGGGRLSMTDIEVVLTGPPAIAPERLKAAVEQLDAALPAVFSLATVPPSPTRRPLLPTAGLDGGAPPRFDATLLPDGTVRLAGPLQSATSREAVQSYATALFGHDRVTDGMVIDPKLPAGWPGRVLAGVEALAELREGTLQVTPEMVSLRGSGRDADADDRIAALFAARIGADARVDVRYEAPPIEPAAASAPASASPAPAAAPPPQTGAPAPRPPVAAAGSSPQDCADDIAAILEAGPIRFFTGSARIDPASRGVVAAIADVLRGCPGAGFEIGAYTDSRGPADFNRRISQQRAEAVLADLRDAGLAQAPLTARGYGADSPIADNKTEPGRARNRRIVFALAAPPTPAAAVPAEEVGGEPD